MAGGWPVTARRFSFDATSKSFLRRRGMNVPTARKRVFHMIMVRSDLHNDAAVDEGGRDLFWLMPNAQSVTPTDRQISEAALPFVTARHKAPAPLSNCCCIPSELYYSACMPPLHAQAASIIVQRGMLIHHSIYARADWWFALWNFIKAALVNLWELPS
jgi:hypothetical protein